MKKEETKRLKEIFKLEDKLKEAYKLIENLKNDIKTLDAQIAKKEKKIHEYKYKINDLQKSKHVLSYRTSEMRKSLEPKET